MAVVRVGVLRCPHWPAVVAGIAPGEPVAVFHANRVVACSPTALREGITLGMRRRQAQARCPALRIEAHDPVRDGRAFESVARAVAELVPRLEITEPGVLTFAARGPSRYFGGDVAMAERIAGVVPPALEPLGGEAIPFGIGVADGRFSAAVAARGTGVRVVPHGESATFLAPAPVTLLHEVGGLPFELVDVLQRLGVTTMGALAALPAADVLARFGHAGALAHRIASGGDDRAVASAVPPPEWALAHTFDDPVQQLDAVVFVAKQMAGELLERLSNDGKVCTRLVVCAETEHGERSERVWYRPSGLSAPAIVERVRWQLDGWAAPAVGTDLDDVPTAGVVLLRLEPEEMRPDRGAQAGFWGGRSQADEWAARAVVRVAGLAGDQHVLVAASRGGRLPDDAYSWMPAALADLTDPYERLTVRAVPWPGQIPAPSPTIVYPDPLPAEVRDVHGLPVHVSGRGVVSSAPATIAVNERRMRHVVGWAGPWPMDEKWWRTDHRRLARFQLLTADREAFLLAVERQQWWVIGRYA